MQKPKVTEISPTLFEVLGHSIKIQTKKGRKLLICDCFNDTKFCNESPFCRHKELVVGYILKKPTKEKLDKLIKFYEGQVEIKSNINAEIILNDLNELRRIL